MSKSRSIRSTLLLDQKIIEAWGEIELIVVGTGEGHDVAIDQVSRLPDCEPFPIQGCAVRRALIGDCVEVLEWIVADSRVVL